MTGSKKRSPGYLRWGREQGCDFFNKTARSSWPSRYRITDPKGFTLWSCSPDNREAQMPLLKWCLFKQIAG